VQARGERSEISVVMVDRKVFCCIMIALISVSVFGVTLRIVSHVSASPEWYDLSWTRRRPITIGNGFNPSVLVDYQVKINIDYDSDMKTDFSDLRFTSSDGVTLVPYWIENYGASVSAVVWVKVPIIPSSGQTTIFMYYGNPNASSSSNGSATFSFFDDFAEGAEWTPYSGNPVLSPSGTEGLIAVRSVLCVDGTYYMYYGYNSPSGHRIIGRATSLDGFHWTKDPSNPLLSASLGQWDSVDVSMPIVWCENGEWYMLYGGNAVGLGSWHIGLATSSDGVDWTKSASNPVIPENVGQWDSSTEPSSIIKIDDTYYLWYYSIPHEIGLATSTDLITWTRDPNNPIFQAGYSDASIFERDGHYYLTILSDTGQNFFLYRDESCTFYPADREYLFQVWGQGGSEHSPIMTDNVYRNSFSASSDQLWCYWYDGTSTDMLIESDFDSALLPAGAGWTQDVGTWTWSSTTQGTLTSSATGENTIRVTDFSLTTGYAVRARMSFAGTGGNYFGTLFAYQDPSDFYTQRGYAADGGSQIKFTKDVAGVFTDLNAQSNSWNEKQYYVLESQWKSSNEIDTFVNDSLVAAITTGLESWTSGGVGIRNYHPAGDSGSCDWFIIRKCSSPEPTTTAGPEEPYTLSITTIGNGSVDLNETGPYQYGEVVQLTAIPAIGWSFDHWSGDLSGSANPNTIILDTDKTVTATFTQDHYTLTVTVVGGGSVNTSVTAQNWWSSNFGYRMKITFNNSAINENLIDFAVPVVFSAAQTGFWQHVNRTTGSDIRFIFSDNATELYYSIEKFDATNNASVIWVKTNISASSTNDYIWIYYGNSTVGFDNHGNSVNVWDHNFTFISYMKDDPDSSHVKDSTANNNNGAKASAGNPADTTSGKIGDAQSFNGPTSPYSYITLPASNTLITSAGTLAAWVQLVPSSSTNGRILCLMRGSGFGSGFTIQNYVGHWGSYTNNGTTGNNLDSGVTVDTNWHFIVATDDGTTHSMYVDGVLKASETLGTLTGTHEAYIGTYDTTTTDYMWKGLIDEASISNIARDAAWIKASYQYSSDQSKFAYASEESRQSEQATYTYGTVVTLIAFANSGWSFSGWSGDAFGTDNPTSLTMTDNKSVTAMFILPTLQMSPNSKTCRMFGEAFSTEVSFSDAFNVTGLKFEIHFNTTLLEYVGTTWNAWGSGTIIVDEANGNLTGATFGGALNGTQTVLTIGFSANYHHIWKNLQGWTNEQTGEIYVQWANLSYGSGPDSGYVKGGLNQIIVGPDASYTFSPIKGDINNDGTVDIQDLTQMASHYDQVSPEFNLVGDPVVDIFDLVAVASNFWYVYTPP
jgi:hypothetical protein